MRGSEYGQIYGGQKRMAGSGVRISEPPRTGSPCAKGRTSPGYRFPILSFWMETVVSAGAGACAVVGGPASLPCASSTSIDS